MLLPRAASTSTQILRQFSTTASVAKKSHRARGATRKSPRNAALFAALAGEEPVATKKKVVNKLDAKEGEVLYTLEQACEALQAHAKERPANALDVAVVTSVSSHMTNALRGRIAYPRDPRTKRETLLVFAEEDSEATEAVKAILADEKAENPSIIVGGSPLVQSVASGRTAGFTKVLCTQSLLPEVSRALARSLGPKGLMPNPRRGTVVPADDAERTRQAIRDARGASDWRSDKVGVIRTAIARIAFDAQDVRKNFTTLVDAIVEKVPTLGTQNTGGAAPTPTREFVERDPRGPGELKRAASMIKQIHLSSTQGPAYKLDLRNVLK